ncbi:MAG TPA: hypothetical protein VHB45_09815 [Alloacidobacterium sp.]|nr:hypothetical protein [Alloacidobacterium sp.]
MDDSPIETYSPVMKRLAPYVVAVVVGGAGLGYAVHEHHAAQSLATQNEQISATLASTHSQLEDLTAKVNALAAPPKPAPEPAPASSASTHIASGPAGQHAGASRLHENNRRYSKLQAELDAQNKRIDETQSNLENARTELTSSIARTHDELVLLEKKGERAYFEFDIQKSKQFQREGPLGIRLKKANTKHGYADLELMVDDRNLSQKHVNIFQPVTFYASDSQQPLEVVINDVTKNHIHGYVSAPKYSQAELASAAVPGTESASANPSAQTVSSSAQPPTRKKLPVPQPQ